MIVQLTVHCRCYQRMNPNSKIFYAQKGSKLEKGTPDHLFIQQVSWIQNPTTDLSYEHAPLGVCNPIQKSRNPNSWVTLFPLFPSIMLGQIFSLLSFIEHICTLII